MTQDYMATLGNLLHYLYFKETYMLIAIDLRQQLVLNAGPKAIHQINFLGKLECDVKTTMFFII